jgi:hypothetical protein
MEILLHNNKLRFILTIKNMTIYKKIGAFLTSVSILGISVIIPTIPSAQASIDNWQKGITVEPRWTEDYGSDSFKASINKLATTHANYVSLTIPYYQSNIYSTDIQPGWNTPTDQSLTAGIDYIHSKGIKVMLILHLESYDGQWRALINPGDRNTWYANYTNVLKHIATIGQKEGAEALIIGVELIDMASQIQYSDNGTRWTSMINQIRPIYSGSISYGANWGEGGWYNEVENINFWDKLDFIGISAYFNLNSGGDVASLKGQWDYWNNREINPVHQRWNKDIVFTEIGYRSVSGAHYHPWDYSAGGGVDQTEQANDYQALFDYWTNQAFFKGVQIWVWSTDPNAGGQTADYTPQNKPAQQIITQWFGSTGTDPAPSPSNPAFTSTGSIDNMSPLTNQALTLKATIQNTGSDASNLNIDIEVRDQNNQQIFQQTFLNESLIHGGVKSYTASWTPKTSGQYRMTIGVFNSNWTIAYNWNDNAATFFVGNNTATPTPTPTVTPSPTSTPTPNPTQTPSPSPTSTPTPPTGGNSIDVWWPTAGSHLTGTQPFKGLVSNQDVSQYNLYWQVDGDRLNQMATNNTDWPHKESLVDLSNWSWNSSGLYHLNFVAKDLGGNVINQRSLDIYVP